MTPDPQAPSPEAAGTHKYTMTLDMRVLEHLGIRLYSNVAAVISELVANSWDADATKVTIDFKDGKLTIVDDGVGMTASEINQRFLTVGYEKRKIEGETSKKFGRQFMGRKGIGKLSALSMAKTISVYSSKDGEQNAFRITVKDLEAAIKANGLYHPVEINFDPGAVADGTTLVLEDLIKKRADITVAALRKRIARRFSVIGHQGADGNAFKVAINGKPVGFDDRDDLRSLEFLWEFGEASIPKLATQNLHKAFLIEQNRILGHPDWVVRGWFGTAKKPADLDSDEEVGSMRNIVVLARGRLIQESILDKLGFNRIFGSYVTGLIEADFLDVGGEEDIATSDRQRLIEDDSRVIALRNFMRDALLAASDQWAGIRRSKKADDALNEYTPLSKWLAGLPEGSRPAARSMIGMIGEIQLDADKESDRAQLYRSGLLAFERLRLQETAHNLERLESLDAAQLLPLLVAQDFFESALYAEIVRTRIEAIKQFQHLTDDKAKESVLQKHLFENLWLLDPGWERVESSKSMEHRLQRDFPKEFAVNLTDEQTKGRVDIRYRESSGTHIIVELKKYERKLLLDVLLVQGKKYHAALYKLLKQDNDPDPRIEIVFVLGQPPVVSDAEGLSRDYVAQQLKLHSSRIVNYDEMITKALKAYEKYLKANEKADQVSKLVQEIAPLMIGREPARRINATGAGRHEVLPAQAADHKSLVAPRPARTTTKDLPAKPKKSRKKKRR